MLLQCDALTEKICTKCKQLLPINSFTKGPDRGFRYQCRSCNLEYQTKSEHRPATAARYYAKMKEQRPEVYIFKQAKHRALFDYGNMEFTITVDDIKIPDKCPYLGIPFIALDKQYGHSLDRIDSSKGYTPDNIQVISRLANIMKNCATKEQLIAFAKGVLEVHSKEVGSNATSM